MKWEEDENYTEVQATVDCVLTVVFCIVILWLLCAFEKVDALQKAGMP